MITTFDRCSWFILFFKKSVSYANNGNSIPVATKVIGIVDSGTTQIIGDQNTIDEFNAAAGILTDPYGNYYVYQSSLSSVPDLVFTLNGYPFALTPTQYVTLVYNIELK